MLPTPGLDIADNGLSALVDVDVLDGDALLAFAAVLVQSEQQIGIAAGQLPRLPKAVLTPLESLFRDRKGQSGNSKGRLLARGIERRF